MIPRLIVVPLSSHEVDGVRKEKERLTAAVSEILWIIDTAHYEWIPATHVVTLIDGLIHDEPTWRCHQNPFIGALGIQEPVIPGEPLIKRQPMIDGGRALR